MAKYLEKPCPVFHAIVSIKNDGHSFPGTGVGCTDGLNVTLTHGVSLPLVKEVMEQLYVFIRLSCLETTVFLFSKSIWSFYTVSLFLHSDFITSEVLAQKSMMHEQ